MALSQQVQLLMNSLSVPKLMQWSYSLDQRYKCQQKILVTSGCSFTSSTLQLETAASWPGYVIDRCRLDQGVDYSYPGAGNEYIGDSILYHFSTVKDHDVKNYLVVVMWSGIDRSQTKLYNSSQQPKIGSTSYIRDQVPIDIKLSAKKSADKILEVYNYLTYRQIPFAFSFYCNLLFPPYLPKADTTCEFNSFIDRAQLKQLQLLPWIPKHPLEFLYEYAFINNYLNDGDRFHPPAEANLKWTDNILLPQMAEQGLLEFI
jgi:hypothetical protein